MSSSYNSDSDSQDEYEALRRRNIAEKERLFAELNLGTLVSETKLLFQVASASKKKDEKRDRVPRRRSSQVRFSLPSRRSVRIEKKSFKVKRVKGFKGFRDPDISGTKESCDVNDNSQFNCGRDETVQASSTSDIYFKEEICDLNVNQPLDNGCDEINKSNFKTNYRFYRVACNVNDDHELNPEKEMYDETVVSNFNAGFINEEIFDVNDNPQFCNNNKNVPNSDLIVVKEETFDVNDNSQLSNDNEGCEGNDTLNEESAHTSRKNKITVQFPWHKKLYSKIYCNGASANCSAEEKSVLQKIVCFSTNIENNKKNCSPEDTDDDDDEDDWDQYEKVEFYISTEEEESDDSDYNSDVEKENSRGKRRRESFRRSTSGVPSVLPEDVTDDMISKIAQQSSGKVYDSDNGTTCHQCRQKTRDTKTVCRSGKCVGVRGMFCGLCLPKRYGENVADALRNPQWECPVCRGICNCSFCRARAGKTPTGILYPLVKNRGYENVAQFLQECDKENNSNIDNKRKKMKVVCVRGEL